jgi:hypothetical protein
MSPLLMPRVDRGKARRYHGRPGRISAAVRGLHAAWSACGSAMRLAFVIGMAFLFCGCASVQKDFANSAARDEALKKTMAANHEEMRRQPGFSRCNYEATIAMPGTPALPRDGRDIIRVHNRQQLIAACLLAEK